MPISTRRSVKRSFNTSACIAMALALPILFSSCSLLHKGKKRKRAHKTTVTATADTGSTQHIPGVMTGNVVATDADAAVLAELAPLWARRILYHTFSGKAKVSFSGPDNSADFSANFRIAKDSIVWVNVTALGGLYPVARMLVTRDSFFMIDFTQKEVTMLPLSDVGKVLPVPVGLIQLQNLLVGDPVADGRPVGGRKDEKTWTLRTEDTLFLQQLSYQPADSTLITGNLRTRRTEGPSALLGYSNYAVVNDRILSTNRTVNITNGLNNYNLEMNIVNPEFDQDLSYPFSVPRNYTIKVR